MDGIELYRFHAACPRCKSPDVKVKETLTRNMPTATITVTIYECQNDCAHKFEIVVTVEGNVVDITKNDCL